MWAETDTFRCGVEPASTRQLPGCLLYANGGSAVVAAATCCARHRAIYIATSNSARAFKPCRSCTLQARLITLHDVAAQDYLTPQDNMLAKPIGAWPADCVAHA